MGEEGDEAQTPISKWVHLWSASNALLKSAPTISRHIAHKLTTEGEEHMTPFTKQLICKYCGTLTWTSSVRIRKKRRSSKSRRNKVLARCTKCNGVSTQPGGFVVKKEERRKLTVCKPKKERSTQEQRQAKDPNTTNTNTGKRTLKQLKTKKTPASKKKKSVQESGSKSTRMSEGLASSFLFQDIGDGL